MLPTLPMLPTLLPTLPTLPTLEDAPRAAPAAPAPADGPARYRLVAPKQETFSQGSNPSRRAAATVVSRVG